MKRRRLRRRVIPLKVPLKVECASHPGFKVLFPSQLAFASSMSVCRQAQPTARTERNDVCVR